MTYHVTAFTNNRARLIASETRTDSEAIANLAKAHYEAQGYIVTVRVEE